MEGERRKERKRGRGRGGGRERRKERKRAALADEGLLRPSNNQIMEEDRERGRERKKWKDGEACGSHRVPRMARFPPSLRLPLVQKRGNCPYFELGNFFFLLD